jgi:hypothetical protein
LGKRIDCKEPGARHWKILAVDRQKYNENVRKKKFTIRKIFGE